MKTDEAILDHTSTMDGQTIRMSLDTASLPHLMGILTSIYSDPQTAIIREVISNALDSRAISDTSREIRVTAPSTLDPNFTVQDFGVGMSVDDIKNVFARYGSSTKRDDNLSIGMMGIGAKSPLAYTGQFTMTCIRDGVRAQALISRAGDGGNEIQIVDTRATDEPNGVTVRVPIHTDVNVFRAKLTEFLTWVDRDAFITFSFTVPDRRAIMSFDNFEIYSLSARDSFGKSSHLVMGGVAYPISMPVACAVFAPIGSVNVTPSREELMYTAKTSEYLDKQREVLKNNLVAELTKQIDAMPDHTAARQKYDSLAKNGLRDVVVELTYHGEQIPTTRRQPIGMYSIQDHEAHYARVPFNPSYAKVYGIVAVYNFPSKRASAKHKAILDGNLPNAKSAVLYGEGNPFDPWWNDLDVEVYDWNKFDKSYAPSAPTKQPHNTHMLLTVRDSYGGLSNVRVDTETPLYVEVGSRYEHARGINELGTVYRVQASRKDAFHKRYPRAVHVSVKFNEKIDAALGKISQHDLALAMTTRGVLQFNSSDGCKTLSDQILDPILKDVLQTRVISTPSLPYGYQNNEKYRKASDEAFNINQYLKQKYPLLFLNSYGSVDITTEKHLIMYCNMIHTQN